MYCWTSVMKAVDDSLYGAQIVQVTTWAKYAVNWIEGGAGEITLIHWPIVIFKQHDNYIVFIGTFLFQLFSTLLWCLLGCKILWLIVIFTQFQIFLKTNKISCADKYIHFIYKANDICVDEVTPGRGPICNLLSLTGWRFWTVTKGMCAFDMSIITHFTEMIWKFPFGSSPCMAVN